MKDRRAVAPARGERTSELATAAPVIKGHEVLTIARRTVTPGEGIARDHTIVIRPVIGRRARSTADLVRIGTNGRADHTSVPSRPGMIAIRVDLRDARSAAGGPAPIGPAPTIALHENEAPTARIARTAVRDTVAGIVLSAEGAASVAEIGRPGRAVGDSDVPAAIARAVAGPEDSAEVVHRVAVKGDAVANP